MNIMKFYAAVISVFILFTSTLSQNVPLRGPPQFETNPQYLDSYIPASMQVIAYLTEMMKYDIKPIVATTTIIPPLITTTTTKRPATITTRRPIIVTLSRLTTKRPSTTTALPSTQYHKPALYAPFVPPSFIISRTPTESSYNVDSYEAYVNRLKNPLGDYFDRYRQSGDAIGSIIDQLSRVRRATPFDYKPASTKWPHVKAGTSRTKRARPINTNRAQENREPPGQQYISLKASRAQPVQQRPALARSRSARSLSPDEYVTESEPLNPLNINVAPFSLEETNNAKGRALTISAENFNARSVDYLGFGLNELIKEMQSEREGIENRLTDDARVKIFSTKYDDVNFGSYLLRQKKIPPTKAYVTLLSLYDLLNKESKKLMLNKYNGYATTIIEELAETSTGTSSEQLQSILQRIIDRHDTSDMTIRTKITSLVTDLTTTNSYINDALRYIPPLPFSRS